MLASAPLISDKTEEEPKNKPKDKGKAEKQEIAKPKEPEPEIETPDEYKAEIIAENPGYIGDIRYNPKNKRLYFVKKEEEGENVYSIGFKDGKLDEADTKLEFESVLRPASPSRIALDRSRGNFFIYQEDGERDNLRFYDAEGKLTKDLENPYKEKHRRQEKATDLAVNPANGNLFLPVWMAKRVDSINISGEFAPKPFSSCSLYSHYVAFDSNGVMYLGKFAMLMNLEKSVRIEKISAKRKEQFNINLQEIVEAQDLDEYVEEGFSLEHMIFGKNLLLSGNLGFTSPETGIVLSVDSQLKKASLVAKVSEYLIGGVDTGESGEIYISMQPLYYPHKRTGKIVRVAGGK